MSKSDKGKVDGVDIFQYMEDHHGFIGVPPNDPLIAQADRSIDFLIDHCSPIKLNLPARILPAYDDKFLGFTETGEKEPSIQATYSSLMAIQWARQGLHINDVVSRLLERKGEDALIKIARFTSKCFGKDSTGNYSAFKHSISDSKLDLRATDMGVQILYLLSEAFGEKRAIPQFKEIAGNDAFLQIYRFVKSCFSTGKQRGTYATFVSHPELSGAYRVGPKEGALNTVHTYHALETLRFILPELDMASV